MDAVGLRLHAGVSSFVPFAVHATTATLGSTTGAGPEAGGTDLVSPHAATASVIETTGSSILMPL